MCYGSAMNLVDEPWIPVLRDDGPRELSLHDVVSQADRIAGIVSGETLVDAAILRMLFALDVASEGNWVQWVNDHRDRFNLFDETAPVWQNPAMAAHWDITGVSQPALTLPRLNGSPDTVVSSYDSTREQAFTPAQAARYLLARQQFSCGGIQSHPTGKVFGGGRSSSARAAVANGRPFLHITAPTLADTLRLNRVPGPRGVFQFSWPRDVTPASDSTPQGQADSLTWLSRSMLLLRDSDGLVRTYQSCGGLYYGADTDPNFLPHTTFEKKKADAEWTPRAVHQLRPPWRQILDAYATETPGILAHLTDSPEGTRLVLTGLASFQARIDGYITGSTPLPAITPAAAVELSNAVAAAHKTVSSTVGAAGYGIHGSDIGRNDWYGRTKPHPSALTTHLSQPVLAAMAGQLSIPDALSTIRTYADDASGAFINQLTATHPIAAGRATARLAGASEKEPTT